MIGSQHASNSCPLPQGHGSPRFGFESSAGADGIRQAYRAPPGEREGKANLRLLMLIFNNGVL
jgi:hypothetical protein